MKKRLLVNIIFVLLIVSTLSTSILAEVNCFDTPNDPACADAPADSGDPGGFWSKPYNLVLDGIHNMNSGFLKAYGFELNTLNWVTSLGSSDLPFWIFSKFIKIVFYALLMTAMMYAIKTAWTFSSDMFFVNLMRMTEPLKAMAKAILGVIIYNIKFALIYIVIVGVIKSISNFASLEDAQYSGIGMGLVDTLAIAILVILGLLVIVSSLIALIGALLYKPVGVFAYMIRSIEGWANVSYMLDFILNFFLLFPVLFLGPSFLVSLLSIENPLYKHLILSAAIIAGVGVVFIVNKLYPFLLEAKLDKLTAQRSENLLRSISGKMVGGQTSALQGTANAQREAAGAVVSKVPGATYVQNQVSSGMQAMQNQQAIVKGLASENAVSMSFKSAPLQHISSSLNTTRDYFNPEIRGSMRTQNETLRKVAQSKVENKAKTIESIKDYGSKERRLLRSLA